jgi:hypothetical protein
MEPSLLALTSLRAIGWQVLCLALTGCDSIVATLVLACVGLFSSGVGTESLLAGSVCALVEGHLTAHFVVGCHVFLGNYA